MNTCSNCANSYAGNFCNECGQKNNSGRIYFRELAHDFFSNFFTLETPVYRTIKFLTLKPGNVARDFIFGKRKTYYRPVQYFILGVAFYLLIRAILGFNPIDNQFRAMGKEMPPPHVMSSIPMQASSFMAKNLNLLLFIFVFIFSAFSRLFFRKSGFNYIENVVFGFYSIGHYIFLSTFIIPLTFINPKLYYIVYFILIGYLTFALVSFHKTKLFSGILKGLVTIILGFTIYVMIVYTATIYTLIFIN
ncbi:MAG: DUF3667 domain-containing protein [Ignavibacteriales bacterium]|nr:MAG: DUF3667 domain-containing protein [Ignavibacteriales bacterium]